MITKPQVESIFGSVDAFSEQVIRNEHEGDGSYFYTIFKGTFHIYISVYPTEIYDDRFLTTIVDIGMDERLSTGYGSNDIKSTLDWIKKKIEV